MTARLVELGYAALDEEHCLNCNTAIEFQRLKLDYDAGEDRLETEYICQCGACSEIFVENQGDVMRSTIQLDEDTRTVNKTPIGVLERRRSRIHPTMEAIYELVAAKGILHENWKVFDQASEQVYEWAKNELSIDTIESQTDDPVNLSFAKSDNLSGYHAAIHNYLSMSYTFTQVLESQKTHLIRNAELDKKYSDFINNSVIVKGLRIFSQHEQIIPISFQINNDPTNERVLDFTVELDKVDTLPSQISRDRPDGYDGGSDQYYSEVEGRRINLSQQFAEFQHEGLKLSASILETILEEEREAIEAYESANTGGLDFSDDFLSESP